MGVAAETAVSTQDGDRRHEGKWSVGVLQAIVGVVWNQDMGLRAMKRVGSACIRSADFVTQLLQEIIQVWNVRFDQERRLHSRPGEARRRRNDARTWGIHF